jgi:opacity protein-like surface antigen
MSSIRIKITKSILLLMLFSSANAHAFKDSRNGKWEFFLSPQFTDSKILEFGNGSKAEIDDRSSIALGFGYNLNHHIELTTQFAYSDSNYTGTRILEDTGEAEKFTANLYTSSINFGFTYNLLRTPFTPYISANIGATYIDSGIPTGDVGSICWWDPWWGYICSPTALTYTTTEFNYGAGVGLRYDFNRKLYIKGGANINVIDASSSNTADFTTYQFTFGFMF